MEKEYNVKELLEINNCNKVKELLETAIVEKVLVSDIAIRNNLAKSYVVDFIKRRTHKDSKTTLTKEELESLIEVNERYKRERINKMTAKDNTLSSVETDSDVDYDERSYGSAVRSSDEFFEKNGNRYAKILEYNYCIKVRGREDLCGVLSREEMAFIHRLYTMYGAALTQREVCRYFPQFTFVDFKRILRAFNISKASIPISIHELEENSEEHNLELIFKNNEVNLLKKVESLRPKFFEDEYKRLLIENDDLKNDFKYWKEIFSNWKFDETPFYIEQSKNEEGEEKKSFNLYLADMHIGANVPIESIYQNEYNEKEVNNRFNKILTRIKEDFNRIGRFDCINVFNLGDDLDGLNAETTRGGHKLPQNLNNKEQFNVFINAMIRFIEELHKLNVSNKINYYACTDSNHSGDFGYMVNKALEMYFNQRFPQMNIRLFEKFIEYLQIYDRNFIISHGKDKEDLKNGFPLTLNDKIENYILKYMNENRITGKTSFISADLHQTSFQRHRYFNYYKVSSFFGSSKWIHNNFGNTKAGTDYEIIFENGSTKFDFIELN